MYFFDKKRESGWACFFAFFSFPVFATFVGSLLGNLDFSGPGRRATFCALNARKAATPIVSFPEIVRGGENIAYLNTHKEFFLLF